MPFSTKAAEQAFRAAYRAIRAGRQVHELPVEQRGAWMMADEADIARAESELAATIDLPRSDWRALGAAGTAGAAGAALLSPDEAEAEWGGPSAANADLDALAAAEEMEFHGLPRERIFDETGWFRVPGPEGSSNWRFRLRDDRAERVIEPGFFSDVVSIPSVEEAYPDADPRYVLEPGPRQSGGTRVQTGRIRASGPEAGFDEVLIHENQHMIDALEGDLHEVADPRASYEAYERSPNEANAFAAERDILSGYAGYPWDHYAVPEGDVASPLSDDPREWRSAVAPVDDLMQREYSPELGTWMLRSRRPWAELSGPERVEAVARGVGDDLLQSTVYMTGLGGMGQTLDRLDRARSPDDSDADVGLPFFRDPSRGGSYAYATSDEDPFAVASDAVMSALPLLALRSPRLGRRAAPPPDPVAEDLDHYASSVRLSEGEVPGPLTAAERRASREPFDTAPPPPDPTEGALAAARERARRIASRIPEPPRDPIRDNPRAPEQRMEWEARRGRQRMLRDELLDIAEGRTEEIDPVAAMNRIDEIERRLEEMASYMQRGAQGPYGGRRGGSSLEPVGSEPEAVGGLTSAERRAGAEYEDVLDFRARPRPWEHLAEPAPPRMSPWEQAKAAATLGGGAGGFAILEAFANMEPEPSTMGGSFPSEPAPQIHPWDYLQDSEAEATDLRPPRYMGAQEPAGGDELDLAELGITLPRVDLAPGDYGGFVVRPQDAARGQSDQGEGEGEADVAPDPRLFSVAEIDPANPNHVRELQRTLAEAGFDPGPIDGVRGSRTKAAEAAVAREYGREPADDPTLAYRLAVGLYRGPARVRDVQGGLMQNEKWANIRGGADNIYGSDTRGALGEYLELPPDDPSLDDLTQDELDDIRYGRMLGNRYWREQRERRLSGR